MCAEITSYYSDSISFVFDNYNVSIFHFLFNQPVYTIFRLGVGDSSRKATIGLSPSVILSESPTPSLSAQNTTQWFASPMLSSLESY